MKKLLLLVTGFLCLASVKPVDAVTYHYSYSYSTSTGSTKVATTSNTASTSGYNYIIDSFDSKIKVNQDSSLGVTETIKTNFYIPKHGIFRIIPYVYSAKGKTIRARLTVEGVTDEKGKAIPYEEDIYNLSKRLKIGDANKTITGEQTYVIKYQISKVLLDYGQGPEVYWNATGSEWDTKINKVTAEVDSPWATITQIDCSSGAVGLSEKSCQTNYTETHATFASNNLLGTGKDFTIMVQLNPTNQIKMPGTIEKISDFLADNWGYPVALAPLVIMWIAWFKKGRDLRYTSENVFYKPDVKTEKTVSLFYRPHLPMVYGPINGLTPAEVGTIIDEKVDTKDVVAEIVELARLGYIKIEKIETKKFLGKDTDYKLTGTGKDTTPLKEFQKYLLESIFSTRIKTESETTLVADVVKTTKTSMETIGQKKEVMISDLKDNFYTHLEPLRKKIYNDLVLAGMMPEDPRTTKAKWGGIVAGLLITAVTLSIIFITLTGNAGPLVLSFIIMFPTIFLSSLMARRTAWGYSMYRQAVGLKYYLGKGKWREEIAEKQLFLEEMLPLAIALGIVGKLAHDMEQLGVEPPTYFNGTSTTVFVHDIHSFNSTLGYNMAFTASTGGPAMSWSGRGSWSGSSGFHGGGGGFSGGGFGGGGGGSW